MTVVFEQPELYRRLKVHAAERGVPMKQVIEEAILRYLDEAEEPGEMSVRPKVLDWDRWDAFQAELDALPETPGSRDASNVKRQLYGERELTEQGWRYVAEEPAEYDAR